jgi:hypothetical protein
MSKLNNYFECQSIASININNEPAIAEIIIKGQENIDNLVFDIISVVCKNNPRKRRNYCKESDSFSILEDYIRTNINDIFFLIIKPQMTNDQEKEMGHQIDCDYLDVINIFYAFSKFLTRNTQNAIRRNAGHYIELCVSFVLANNEGKLEAIENLTGMTKIFSQKMKDIKGKIDREDEENPFNL